MFPFLLSNFHFVIMKQNRKRGFPCSWSHGEMMMKPLFSCSGAQNRNQSCEICLHPLSSKALAVIRLESVVIPLKIRVIRKD